MAKTLIRNANILEGRAMNNVFLTVVVAYNLPGCLRNFVNSYLKYCKQGSLLIVDNQSSNQIQQEYLKAISSSRIIVKILDKPNLNESKVGSLYDANNYAIEYAKTGNYKYIILCQDDMQFFRFSDNLEIELDRLYLDASISMVNPTAMKEKEHLNSTHYKWNNLSTCWANTNYASIDVAIISLNWIVENNFKFLDTETRTSESLLHKGFRVAVLKKPFLVFIPWPPVRRRGVIIGSDLPITDELFFLPNDTKIRHFNEEDAREVYAVSDYCIPNYAKVLYPYWFTDIQNIPLESKRIFKARYLKNKIGSGTVRIPQVSFFIKCIVVVWLRGTKNKIYSKLIRQIVLTK